VGRAVVEYRCGALWVWDDYESEGREFESLRAHHFSDSYGEGAPPFAERYSAGTLQPTNASFRSALLATELSGAIGTSKVGLDD
jgi:hypothetical protein